MTGREWPPGEVSGRPSLGVLLPFVLVSFAANSLITRFVVGDNLLDAGVLGAARFVAGAIVLAAIALLRGERALAGRAHLLPALWLGLYAACISYGYRYIGAAAGTVVFYCAVLVTLIGYDRVTGVAVSARRVFGAAVALAGVATLALESGGIVTLLGVALLATTGITWGLYTAAGRGVANPRTATTGAFVVVAAVAVGPAAVGVASGLHITVEGLVWTVAMGAVTTALAYIAWYACQRSISATTAGTVQLVIPILTAVGAVALLGEPLTVILFVAAALVAVGMWLARPPAPADAS
jgi:drug/metabolite transporter (DMT)-like permease